MPRYIANVNSNFDVFFQRFANIEAQINSLNAGKSAVLSQVLGSAEHDASFTPSADNTWQTITPVTDSGANNPTVTITVGRSGTVLLIASAQLETTTTSGQQALVGFSYTYTAADGTVTTVGPAMNGSVLVLGTTSGSSGSFGLVASSTGLRTLTGIPSGLVQFDLWYQSAGSLGASFAAADLTVIPV